MGMDFSEIWEVSDSKFWEGSEVNVGIKVETETKGMGWKGVKSEERTGNLELLLLLQNDYI